jgi:hypothetical protein
MVFKKLTLIVIFSLLTTFAPGPHSEAHAKLGLFASTPQPYFSYLGLGLHMTIFNFIRLTGQFGVFRALYSYQTEENQMSYGWGAQVRLFPWASHSPFVGLHRSFYYHHDGKNKGHYLSPSAGYEIEIEKGRGFFGIGAMMVYKKRKNGKWRRKRDEYQSGDGAKTVVLPLLYGGWNFK